MEEEEKIKLRKELVNKLIYALEELKNKGDDALDAAKEVQRVDAKLGLDLADGLLVPVKGIHEFLNQVSELAEKM
jgi:hypothetical protein